MVQSLSMKKNIFIIVLSLTFGACERVLMNDDLTATAANTFDYLWQRFDQQYSMFDVKDVDWQTVYDSLRPCVYNGMPADSLFAVCATMLRTLNDGHVNLYAGFDVSRADSLYYRFYAQGGIDVNTMVLNYLGIGYHSTGGMAHTALCDNRVIYIYYGSFSNTVSPSLLRRIIRSYPEAQGMVLDMRGNGGGSLANVINILRLMPSYGQRLYSSQIKSGPMHDDFTPWVDTYAPDCSGDTELFTRPVVVLVDRGCFSATSVFAICTQAYDNMVLMGDTTSGGLGLPTSGYLPNGWRYRMPVTRTKALDGNNYENGVPPDIPLPFDRQRAQTLGRDNVIDSACSYIINNN